MKYFFILGRHPLLSLAELKAYLEKDYPGNFNYELADDYSACLVETGQEIDIGKTIRDLGGTVKIGKIQPKVHSPQSTVNNENNLYNNLINKIKSLFLEKKISEGKFNFGISVYGTDKINIKHLGMDVKTALKEKGISARWVTSKEKNLSSVVVATNHLLDKGAEFVIVNSGEAFYTGKTLAVQPFRELSFRDYGRPTRDDYSGMLPPKLAKMMINLSGAKNDSVILDPFCGSGTILTEAMLMGYDNLIGSDISEKAVNYTKSNIKWITDNSKLEIQNSKLRIYCSNVLDIEKFIGKNSIDAIITEPYLGPQRGKHDIDQTKNELENLYSRSFRAFDKILKSGGKVAMVWPILMKGGEKVFLDQGLAGKFRILNLLEDRQRPVPDKIQNWITQRGGLVYSRPGQKVLREVLIMEKPLRNQIPARRSGLSAE